MRSAKQLAEEMHVFLDVAPLVVVVCHTNGINTWTDRDNSADQMTPNHDLDACDIAVGKGKNKDFTCSKCAKSDQLRMMRSSTRVFCNSGT